MVGHVKRFGVKVQQVIDRQRFPPEIDRFNVKFPIQKSDCSGLKSTDNSVLQQQQALQRSGALQMSKSGT